MSNVLAQSIFNQAVAERSWRTQVTSAIVHIVVLCAAFLIVVPARKVLEPPSEHITLIAPALPKYHPKIEPPRVYHVAKVTLPPVPTPVAKSIPPPVFPKPVPQPVAKLVPPSIAVTAQPRITAEIKPDLPPPSKPVVKTGSFQDAQLAKTAPVPKQVIVGGFGDPRGVQAADNPKTAPVLMAKVGSFESPLGSGQTGGGGHLDNGSVKQSGFGSVTAVATPGKGAPVRASGFGDGVVSGSARGSGTVRSTGFGDAAAVLSPQRKQAVNAPSPFTPVEILFKPRPSYSPEAREMRLEGQVSLEVVFQASGSVRVVRVIKGLGHGLDEAAEQAATQVRFKPATRSGAAVDTNATISITFELT